MQKILILLCIVLILAPIPFLKIHDDEVIYWSIAKSYSELKPKFFGRMPLPMLIVAPFLRINESFLIPRFIAGIFTLLSAYLICRIISLRYGEGCIEGALIFLFSFYALRFGNRFYLDIFGTFFFLLAIYFIEKNEMGKAGVSSVLAILGRDLWVPVYPFFYIYLRREGKDIKKFALTSLILILPTITIVYLMGLERYALFKCLKISYDFILENGKKIILIALQSWLEFAVVSTIAILGVLLARKSDNLMILIFPQVLVLSLFRNFLFYGALTQYPIGLIATLSILAPLGLKRLWEKYIKRGEFTRALIALLVFQFFVFNYLATSLSVHGAKGIYDLGYWYDRQVIDLLNERAEEGDLIIGVHGAFVEKARWRWVERNVSRGIELEPDWLVTYRTFVEVIGKSKYVEIWEIGPYLIAHSEPRGHMHEVLKPRKFKKWKYRS